MRIKENRNHKKRNIIIATAAVLVIAGGAGTFMYVRNNSHQPDRPENSVDYNKPTKAEKDAGTKAKEDFLNNQDQGGSGSNSSNTPQDDNNASGLNVTISSANQNGQYYQIRTIIPALDDSGTCTLTLTKSGSNTVTQEAGTQILGSYSVCKGFDVPVDGLAKGSWQATVTYKGSVGQGTARQTIEVQ